MKKRICITGTTGLLGNSLLNELRVTTPEIILASRKKPQNLSPNLHWQAFDLSNSTHKINLEDVYTLFHLASSTKKYSYDIDVKGTQRLLEAAQKYQVKHFIYISIVGVDQVPLKYFKIKHQTEQLIQSFGIPYSILRATQFFEFFEQEVIKYQKFPLAILPGEILYQPIETRVVAQELVDLSHRKPQNRILEIGGPEIITLNQALKIWLAHHHKRKLTLNIPLRLLGKIGKALKQGVLTTSALDANSMNWGSWLKESNTI